MLTAYPPEERTWPAVVLLQETDARGSAPIHTLTEALAGELVTRFGDDVLLLEVVDGPGTFLDSSERPHRVRITAGSDPQEAVRRALHEYALRYAYTFVDVTALADAVAVTKRLVAFLDRAELPAALHYKLVRLCKVASSAETCAELAARCPRWHILTSAVLDAEAPIVARKQKPRSTLRALFDRSPMESPRGPKVGESPQMRWYEGCQNPEEVRIRMDAHGKLAPGSLARWARALSDRRFGLALGGSGAWGYAHAALILALEDAQIPIDLVSSASSGSVVGAYYCALGRAGIDRLLAQGWELQLTALTCFFSMLPMERFVARNTASIQLRELEVMFLPVTTNLTTMRMECVTDASLAWGVRASSTAPGLFGSTINAGSVYVDGAVSCNVPVDLVKWRGADVVVAMNALPRPTGIKLGKTPFDLGLRFKQLVKSLGLVFQDLGDWEARGHMTFDAPRVADPLFGTALFYRGREICEKVLSDPNFKSCISEIEEVWRRHTRARSGLALDAALPIAVTRGQTVALGDGLQALRPLPSEPPPERSSDTVDEVSAP